MSRRKFTQSSPMTVFCVVRYSSHVRFHKPPWAFMGSLLHTLIVTLFAFAMFACKFVILFMTMSVMMCDCILECCRSQWSSGSMPDCSARGPRIESRCGQLCLSQKATVIYSLGHGLCAPFLQCLGQLSLLPSVGR